MPRAVIERLSAEPLSCYGDGPTLYWSEFHQRRLCLSVCPQCGSAREAGHVRYLWEVLGP